MGTSGSILIVELKGWMYAFDGIPTYAQMLNEIGQFYHSTEEAWERGMKTLQSVLSGPQPHVSWLPEPGKPIVIRVIKKIANV